MLVTLVYAQDFLLLILNVFSRQIVNRKVPYVRLFCDEPKGEGGDASNTESRHSWPGRNKPLKSTLMESAHGMLDLQKHFGADFRHVTSKLFPPFFGSPSFVFLM